MICTIKNFADITSLPPMEQEAKSLILTQVNLLCQSYGYNRGDDDDGGIILYCPYGTTEHELKEQFDYSNHLPEFVEVSDNIGHALYLTTNEYSISVIMDIADIPYEIKKEIDNNENS